MGKNSLIADDAITATSSSSRAIDYEPIPTDVSNTRNGHLKTPLHTPHARWFGMLFSLSILILLVSLVVSKSYGLISRSSSSSIFSPPPPPAGLRNQAPTVQAMQSLNDFGFKLFSKLSSSLSAGDAGNNKNLVMSPTSIVAALGMVLAGTTAPSTARQELESVLGLAGTSLWAFPSSTTGGVEIVQANSAWMSDNENYQVKNSYKNYIEHGFGAQLFSLPTDHDESVVNHWVSQQTRGHIPTILSQPLEDNLIALLINAIYFRGDWTTAFDVGNTREDTDFHLLSSASSSSPGDTTNSSSTTTIIKVPMMQLFNSDEKFHYLEVPLQDLGINNYQQEQDTTTTAASNQNEIVQIVQLPYGTARDYAATIVLPPMPAEDTTATDSSTTDNNNNNNDNNNINVPPASPSTATSLLDSIVEKLNATLWKEWMDTLMKPEHKQKLQLLAMPRFQLESGDNAMELKSVLQEEMGVREVFQASKEHPPLLELTSNRDAYLDNVLHKATLQVTEEGTVATAATVAKVMQESIPQRLTRVVMNRPFLFVVRHVSSGAILFMARVDEPITPSSVTDG